MIGCFQACFYCLLTHLRLEMRGYENHTANPRTYRSEIRGRGMSTQVLLVECDDRHGLVHAITGVLLQHGVNVVGNQEFVERGAARFFMRTEFDGAVAAVARALQAMDRV